MFTRGYISKMVTQRGAEQYFRSLLQFDDRCLHLSSVYGTIVHFAAQNAQPFTYMPKLNQFVWVLDYKSVGNGAVVPQSIDVQSGRRNELLNMPIFFLQNWGMLGLRLNEAVVGVPKGLLLNGNYAPALVGNCNTISICINVSVSQWSSRSSCANNVLYSGLATASGLRVARFPRLESPSIDWQNSSQLRYGNS